MLYIGKHSNFEDYLLFAKTTYSHSSLIAAAVTPIEYEITSTDVKKELEYLLEYGYPSK